MKGRRNSLSGRATSVACLAAASVLVAAGGAHAASVWHVDPSGDVVVEGPSPDTYAVRDTSHGDIVGFGADYSATTLRVATSIREYQTLRGLWEAKVRTSQGYDYKLRVDLSGHASPVLRRSNQTRPGFHITPCPGVTVSLTTRGVTGRIPTSCLGDAWRVQVGVHVEAYRTYPTVSYEYYDDALADGRASSSGPLTTATLGPWLDQR